MSRQKKVEELLLQIKQEMESETVSASEDSVEHDSDLDKVNEEVLHTDVNSESVSDNIEEDFRQDLYEIPHDVLMGKVIAAKASASQRPTAMSNTNNSGDHFSRFDRDLKKLLTPRKEISKKKLIREIEREDLYNVEKELNKSNQLDDEEYEYFDDGSEDNAGLDTWMQGYHKELSDNNGNKSE